MSKDTNVVADLEIVIKQPMIEAAIAEYAAKRYNATVLGMNITIKRSGTSRINADVQLASNDLTSGGACPHNAEPAEEVAEEVVDATPEVETPEPEVDNTEGTEVASGTEEVVSVPDVEEPVAETAVVEDPAVAAANAEEDDIFNIS